MPRPNKIWYRKARKEWYVTIDGVTHRLGPNRDAAMTQYHALSLKKPGKTTLRSVDQLFAEFILFCKENRAKKTARWYRDFLLAFSDAHPSLLLRELQPLHVQQWLDKQKDWSPSTKRGAVVAIQRAFSWGLRLGYVFVNPVQFMEKPEIGRREKTVTMKEFKDILAAVKDSAFKDYLITAFDTGCRPQELRMVTADHVDLKNARWVFPVSEAKGKRKPRVVYLTDRVLKIVKRLMKDHPEGPLFRTTRGTPWSSGATNCRFRRLKEKLGEKYCVYLFRHTRTTKALEAGLSTETVRELMGHKDGRMIEKHYSHMAQNAAFLREQAKVAARS